MKKILKICGIFIIVIVLFLLIFILADRYEYSKWVNNFLKSRYTEEMTIEEIYLNEFGTSAKLFANGIEDLDFYMKGKYCDTFLEGSLEYDAEQEIKRSIDVSSCNAEMSSLYASAEYTFPELYDLYKSLGRPAKWTEIPEYISLEKIYIRIDNLLSEDYAEKIIDVIYNSSFRASYVEIYDSDTRYEYLYDTQDKKYKHIN